MQGSSEPHPHHGVATHGLRNTVLDGNSQKHYFLRTMSIELRI